MEAHFWLHWEENQPLLLQLCKGWVGGNEAEARELLSSAMLKAWEGAQRTQEEIGNYRAWLAKIVRNHGIDQQRRQNRDPQVKTDPELLAPIAEQIRVTYQASPETGLLKDESYAHLLARMEGLPERLREVMMLRAYQNMSYKEIGQHLKISTENARKRVQLARTLLKGGGDPEQHQAYQHPRAEQEATEAILLHERPMAALGPRYAAPVAFQRFGIMVELPVLQDMRPMRLSQKVETLRKYIDRHPSGWKKELELARLLWALGEADEALDRMAAAFERQPNVPELAVSYLRALQALGDRSAVQAAALLCSEGMRPSPLRELYAGYHTWASGDMEAAEGHWRACPLIGGHLQQARLHLSAGRMDAAADVLLQQLRLQPMDRECFLWLSLALMHRPESVDMAALALRRFPNDPYALSASLVARWRFTPSLDIAEMDAQLAHATRIAPDSYWAMALKVAWAQRKGDQAGAIALAHEFHQIHPHHFQADAFYARLLGAHSEENLRLVELESGKQIWRGHTMPAMRLDLPIHFLECVDLPKFTS